MILTGPSFAVYVEYCNLINVCMDFLQKPAVKFVISSGLRWFVGLSWADLGYDFL